MCYCKFQTLRFALDGKTLNTYSHCLPGGGGDECDAADTSHLVINALRVDILLLNSVPYNEAHNWHNHRNTFAINAGGKRTRFALGEKRHFDCLLDAFH